jgi:hypothetical protein
MPNPAIEALLSQVTNANLMATVTHLSEYNSRLSTAPGAVDAQIWLMGERAERYAAST